MPELLACEHFDSIAKRFGLFLHKTPHAQLTVWLRFFPSDFVSQNFQTLNGFLLRQVVKDAVLDVFPLQGVGVAG